MQLSDTDLRQLHDLAIEAARRAGAHIQPQAGKPQEVMAKEGHTPASRVLTEVDLESQRLILEVLGDSMEQFGLGLLTEESADDASRHQSDYFWCIDPIDGTLPFIENVPGYSVSVGLVSRAGEPAVGVVLDPVENTVYHAWRGGGVLRNSEPFGLGSGSQLTLVIDRSMAEQENYAGVLSRVEEIADSSGLEGVRVLDKGGAAMNACWVLDHAPAVYFKPPKPQRGGGASWDFAGTACLFRELEGGAVGDFYGNPLKLNREGEPYMNKEGVIFASSERLASAVRRMLK